MCWDIYMERTPVVWFSYVNRVLLKSKLTVTRVSILGTQEKYTVYAGYIFETKNIDLRLLKACRSRQFKQFKNATLQSLIICANFWMAAWMCNKNTKLIPSRNLASQNSKPETWDSILASQNSKRSSFKTQGSSLEDWVKTVNLLWAVLYLL